MAQRIRVVLLGDSGVGKTTMGTQFTCKHSIVDMSEPPFRSMLVVDNRQYFVEVMDTSSEEEYRNEYVPNVEGEAFVLMYSIASRQTFERVEFFRQTMLRITGRRPVFILVGNKQDKVQSREVSTDESAALAQSLGCAFLETSAMAAHNVENLFTIAVRMLGEKKQQNGGAFSAPPSTRKKVQMKQRCTIL